jgi:hypothetical protein
MCGHYLRIWDKTLRLVEPKALSIHGNAPSHFPRLEAWNRKRPPTGKHPCKCGRADAFQCWLRTQADELMGENRGR